MWPRLLITANVVPNSLILSTLKMEGRVPLNCRFYQAPHGPTAHRRSLFLFPLIAIKNSKAYLYIHVCICFCIYIYLHLCMFLYVYTSMYTCRHTYMHMVMTYGYEMTSFPHVSRPSTRWLLWGCQPQAPNVLYALEDPCHLFPWHAGSTPGS
jgi:hypothetical protein